MKDSYKKVCEDLAKAIKYYGKVCGYYFHSLEVVEIGIRARALVKADKRRKKG